MKKAFPRIVIFLLALNLLTENLGYLTHQLYQLLGGAFLLFYALCTIPFERGTEKKGVFFWGCLLLIPSLYLLGGSILERIVGTAIFLASLGLMVKSKGGEEKEIPLLFLTVTCYFYFMLFYL